MIQTITPALSREIQDRWDEIGLPLDWHIADPCFASEFYLDRACLCVWNGEISFLKEPEETKTIHFQGEVVLPNDLTDPKP